MSNHKKVEETVLFQKVNLHLMMLARVDLICIASVHFNVEGAESLSI